MMKHREIVTLQVRRIVADVYGWSVAGTDETRALNYFRPGGRVAMTLRLAEEIGVAVPELTWHDLTDVGRLVAFVHQQIASEYAAAD